MARNSSVMVNAPLPKTAADVAPCDRGGRNGGQRETLAAARVARGPRPHRSFAQILGKFYFLDLSENLRRILFDYEAKMSRPRQHGFQGCLIGCARRRQSAAGDAGLMFFLLRMAFWLGVVLVLLPSVTAQQARRAARSALPRPSRRRRRPSEMYADSASASPTPARWALKWRRPSAIRRRLAQRCFTKC